MLPLLLVPSRLLPCKPLAPAEGSYVMLLHPTLLCQQGTHESLSDCGMSSYACPPYASSLIHMQLSDHIVVRFNAAMSLFMLLHVHNVESARHEQFKHGLASLTLNMGSAHNN